MRLLIFGPQGSGKGTYACRMAPALGIPHISTGDIFRAEVKAGTELGRKLVEELGFYDGKLVPDDITMAIVKKRLEQTDARNGFIFDGFPRTRLQAEELDKITAIDAVINLVVPDEILMKRLGNRVQCRAAGHIYNLLTLKPKAEGKCDIDGSELYQREDEKPEALKKRLELYHQQSKPLLEHYRKKRLVIDIEVNDLFTPPEAVVARILEALKGLERK